MRQTNTRTGSIFCVLPSSYFIHIECVKYDILCKNCIELKWFKSMQQSVFFFRSHVAWDTDFPFILGGPLKFLLFEHIFRSTKGNRNSAYKSQNCLPLCNTYTGGSDTSKRVQNMWVGKYVCQNDWKTFNKWSVERLTVNHSPTATKRKTCPKDKTVFVWLTVDRNVCFAHKMLLGISYRPMMLMLIVGCWLWCVLVIFFYFNALKCWIHIDLVNIYLEARRNPFSPIRPMDLIFVQQFPNELFATFDRRESVEHWCLHWFAMVFVASIRNVLSPDWINVALSICVYVAFIRAVFWYLVASKQHILCVNNIEWFIL